MPESAVSNEETITNAIGAHGLWKSRLLEAVSTGQSDFDPEKVKVDNKCEFGLWLHHEIDPTTKADAHYDTAVKLHASFHRLAADILREATTGNQPKAAKLIERHSDYSEVSVELTLALVEWRKEMTGVSV